MTLGNQPVCIALVGLPGSGKTSWRRGFLSSCENPDSWVVVSSDDVIEEKARSENLTYNKAFELYKDQLGAYIVTQMASAKAQNKNVIVDRTNLTGKSREYILRSLPNYRHYLVSFLDVPYDVVLERNANRAAFGRDIPLEVIRNMVKFTCVQFESAFELLPNSLVEEY